MNWGHVFNLLGSIVAVAGLSTLVLSANTASIIIAFGKAFAGSLTAAEGR